MKMKSSFTLLMRAISMCLALMMLIPIMPLSSVVYAQESASNDTISLYFEPTSLQPAYNNAIFVNGVFFDYIRQNTPHTIEIPKNKFKDGQNTVTFICGSNATGTYYDENVPPQTRNHNDPKVKNLKLTVDGTNVIPASLKSYFITDKTIPAAISNRTEMSNYAVDTNYTFGDGAPSGSPHNASLTIPYKIDFVFNVTLPNTPGNTELYQWNVKEDTSYAKTITVSASAKTSNEKLNLFVDDTAIDRKGTGSMAFNYASSGIQANDGNKFKSALYVNDQLTSYLNEDRPTEGIDMSKIKFGEQNTISMLIGNAKGPYDYNVLPKDTNYDDFTVSKFSIVMPDGSVVTPSKVKLYKPKDAGILVTEQNVVTEEDYSDGKVYNMGDGAPGTKNLTLAYRLDLTFDIPDANDKTSFFAIDTTKFSDGAHKITLKANDTVVNTVSVKFDNTAPKIIPNFKDGSTLLDSFLIDASINDVISGVDTTNTKVTLGGREISLPYTASIKELGTDSQILTINAVDKMGNSTNSVTKFSLIDSNPTYSNPVTTVGDNSVDFSLVPNSGLKDNVKVDFYKANVLDSKMSTGVLDKLTISNQNLTGVSASKTGEYVETSSSTGLPYQVYEVDTKGRNGQIQLNFQGHSQPGEKLALQAYNPNEKKWVVLASGSSNGNDFKLSAQVDSALYAVNNKIKVVVAPALVDNGSNTILWLSDTQYYTQRQPLIDSKIYENLMTWAVKQYQSNQIGYVAHTGDIVETSSSETQFAFASNAQNILDIAKVPNGVVSGNHDVGADINNLNYSLFKKYFGKVRYESQAWYGGNYDDNTNHYDLVTIDGHDMVILYLGLGKEALPETVSWANDVLEKYNRRTAIIGVHEYLNPSAGYITYARGEEIFNKIIVPNDNVAMVLCGHDPGASRNIRTVPGTNRKVVEILGDYQNQPNGGDGFIRLLKFENGKMTNKAYSPILGKFNSFPAEQDDFTVDVQLKQEPRVVATKSFTASVIQDEKFGSVTVYSGETAKVFLPKSNVDFKDWYAVITDKNNNFTQTDVFSFDSKVDNKLDKVTIIPDKTTVDRTKTAQFSASAKLQSGADADLSKAAIKYTSSNPSIASVDDKGVVTANKVGSADITAAVTLGGKIVQSNSVTITVNELNMDAVNLGINPDKQLVGAGEEVQVKLNAKGAKNLYGFDSTFSYDPNLFELESVTADKDFAADNSKAYLDYKDDNGKVRIITSLTGAPQGVTGDVNVIDIKLKAKNKDGKTSFAVPKGAKVSDSNGAIFTTPEDAVSELTVANADVTGGGIAINDLVLVARAFGTSSNNQGYNAALDMNKDGVIDIVDISYVAKKVLGL